MFSRLPMLIAMAAGAGLAGLGRAPTVDPVSLDVRPEPRSYASPRRRKTGKSYPFSSDRQNARYARQIAAGQIKNAKCVGA